MALFAAAIVALRESRRLGAEADTHEQLATLRYAGVDRPIARYWNGDYETLTRLGENDGADPTSDLLLVRANAAFRASQRMQQSRAEQAQQLEAVLQAYTTALKAPAFLPDAAYNYEYIARLRENVSRPRASALPRVTDPAAAGDLPGGPTVHGRPGGPPPSMKGEEFEILTPMEYGDRETQPEPNPGGRPLRKG
jgi:hypothetical protein